jgi:hypothetical protein
LALSKYKVLVEYRQVFRAYETVLASSEELAEDHAIKQFATSRKQVAKNEKPIDETVVVMGVTLQE